MFAVFSMGYSEIAVLALGFGCIALPVAVFGYAAWMIVKANRKPDLTQTMTQLQEENARLRQQVHYKER